MGCGEGDDTRPDGDVPTGLTITWESKPEQIPGAGSSGIRIERATFRLANLRIVGDAGPQTLAALTLEWSAGVAPADLPVAGAPSGLYSRCIFDLAPAGTAYAYELVGTVQINDMTRPFTIRDTGTTAISIEYSIMLPPGSEAEIPIEVDIDQIVDAVDFAQVPFQDGRYLIDDGSAQLTVVRNELAIAFDVRE